MPGHYQVQMPEFDTKSKWKHQEAVNSNRGQQVLHKYVRLKACAKKIYRRFHWATVQTLYVVCYSLKYKNSGIMPRGQ